MVLLISLFLFGRKYGDLIFKDYLRYRIILDVDTYDKVFCWERKNVKKSFILKDKFCFGKSFKISNNSRNNGIYYKRYYRKLNKFD